MTWEALKFGLVVAAAVFAVLVMRRRAALAQRLWSENDRLRRGDFTEEEFQGLCHNLDESDAERFRAGCEAYQRKLFGCRRDPALSAPEPEEDDDG